MSAARARSADAEPVLRLLTARTGLTFPASRREAAEKSVLRIMRKAGFSSGELYAHALEERQIPLDDLVDEVTVGETYFFRERPHFEFIRHQVLPAIRSTHAADQKIRVWSAGCASGEEAYSLAMLLEEEGLINRSRVLATDLSRAALARARQATFGRWSLRGCDEAFVARYFREEDSRLVLAERIRKAVTFEILNLALDVYPSAANGTAMTDLILCRNVLIYLDRDTVRDVARRLFDSLAAGGWLITGPSDPPLSAYARFETTVTPGGVFYRRPAAADVQPDVPLPKNANVTTAAPERPRPRVAPSRSTRREKRPTARVAPANSTAVADLADALVDDPAEAALRLRAMANSTTPEAAAEAAIEAVRKHPLSAELHFLAATLMVGLGRDSDAATFLRKAIYLDRSSALAHFLLASILQRMGDIAGATRSYRNALRIASSHTAGDPLPLSDGETYGRLTEATLSHLRLLSPAAGDEERTA